MKPNMNLVRASKVSLMADITHVFRMQEWERVKKQAYCTRCGKRMFAAGSLYRTDDWGNNVCLCEAAGLANMEIVPEGLLWVWGEKVCGRKR